MGFLTSLDIIALSIFLIAWLSFDIVQGWLVGARPSLSHLMAHRRREWMLVMADRDLRMIDTNILQGLQQGSAYFGSTALLAVGGCAALLGATDEVLAILNDITLGEVENRRLFEIKVAGLTVIFVYAFFKFGWSYRLFNYCSILLGSVPHISHDKEEFRQARALEAADMNIIAGKYFTSGQRAIFFALAYLGWFIGSVALLVTTLFVLAVLVRRQFFSQARAILVAGD